MPDHTFRPDEARRELARLRSLPQTPMRSREIAGLERALMIHASMKNTGGTPRSAAVRRARAETEAFLAKDDTDETPAPPPKPAKEVHTVDGQRRVIVRRARAGGDPLATRADQEYEREKVQRLGDIKGMLGGLHRGSD